MQFLPALFRKKEVVLQAEGPSGGVLRGGDIVETSERQVDREPARWHTSGMTDLQRAGIQRSVEAWKRAAPVLESVRRADIRAAKTISSIAAFRGTALAKAKTHPPALTSGLVEQQRWFRRLTESR